ncbi:hypothetical protein COLO4_23384 [Corchorus olitorius]|uniref:Uncharacterized protein n=1 Tax=Corchorus olitorius TaxID=93759 RepID=A0A1R3IH63_9ROSI|nr:hypothetical protein COLO4_23384 [Corchorus olitorius]
MSVHQLCDTIHQSRDVEWIRRHRDIGNLVEQCSKNSKSCRHRA